MTKYDAVVVGGSVSGLLCAREIASRSFSTLVIEEDLEIGVPEKCDGLVSMAGITSLGIVPRRNVIQNDLKRAVFFSPSKKVGAEVNASRQKVIVMDRSRYDKQLAEHAERKGAEVQLGTRVTTIRSRGNEDGAMVITKAGHEIPCKFAVDASGFQSLVERKKQDGLLPAAQYLIEGDWFEKDKVEVYLNQEISPGFFSWVIPISSSVAKMGVAGSSINTFKFMDSFVRERGARIIRRSGAQIVVSGPSSSFRQGRVLLVGDSAGQAKPTTAGGIYTGGMGGLLAGRAVAKALEAGKVDDIPEYENSWRAMFGSEFAKQIQARKIFSKLDNNSLEKLMEIIVESGVLESISEEGDFDMHSIALARAFGVKNVLRSVGLVVTSQIKSIFS